MLFDNSDFRSGTHVHMLFIHALSAIRHGEASRDHLFSPPVANIPLRQFPVRSDKDLLSQRNSW